MKGQMTGTQIPIIIVGIILFLVGALLLIPLIGMGDILPFSIPVDLLPADIGGISIMFIVAGVAGIGLILAILGIANPNYMFQ